MSAKPGPRHIHRLTPQAVAKAISPGRYPDGAGLYLHVGPTGGRSWVLRIQHDNRMAELGLGPLHTVTLAIARRRAQQARLAVLDGKHPLADKQAARMARVALAAVPSFTAAVAAYVVKHRANWTNADYAHQWPRSLETHAYPKLGKLAVSAITPDHIVGVIEPLAAAGKVKLAIDLRTRIENVLDYATARKWRSGDNPARVASALVSLKRDTIEHHAAAPYADMPRVLAALADARSSPYADALAFTILTVVRLGSARALTWDQIALDPVFGWVWDVPSENMKARKLFRVPLADAAVHILRRKAIEQGLSLSTAPATAPGVLVFTSAVGKELRSDFGRIMDTIGCGAFTVHGFRTSFRTWAAETFKVRDYSHEIVEQVLAHKITDAAEAAYARAEALGPRRKLMEEWAAACGVVATLSVVNG